MTLPFGLPVRLGLTARTALILVAAFVLLQAAVLALFWFMIARPLALQSADDQAARLILAAQTWVELPPATRPDYEAELAQRHGIMIEAEPITFAGQTVLQGGLDTMLAAALTRRSGQPLTLRAAEDPEQTSVDLIVSSYPLRLIFPRPHALSRAATLVGLVFAGGGLLTVAVAVFLTRRTAVRLRDLARHAAAVGQGRVPARLPEQGEAEIAALTATLNRLTGEVQGLLENRTVLLAGISHDLRTPLTRLRLAVSLLGDAEPERTAQIVAEVREMDTLIGDMLTLARGLKREDAVEIDWPVWLAEQLAAWPEAMVSGHVEGRPRVRMAPAALRRILINLVENALRYASPGPGGPPIEVRVSGDAAHWEVAVLDRGPGIPAAQCEAVMRPFERLETSRGRHAGGAGLGLAIARQLADAQGWTIRLDGRPGGGLAARVGSRG